jgi:hypothetical protein
MAGELMTARAESAAVLIPTQMMRLDLVTMMAGKGPTALIRLTI